MTSVDTTVFFLNWDISRRRSGVENAALLRAKLFEQELGIVPEILTMQYNPFFAEVRQELFCSGMITRNFLYRNLFDYFQEFDSATCQGSSSITDDSRVPSSRPVVVGQSTQSLEFDLSLLSKQNDDFAGSEHWKIVPVPGTSDSQVFDQNARLRMYRKCSSHTGAIEYINLFRDGRKWRRDTYATSGYLSRVQFLDSGSGKSQTEYFLRPDGSVAIVQQFSDDSVNQRVQSISLFNHQGRCDVQFSNHAQFISYWLERLTEDPTRKFLMISDKNQVCYSPLRVIKARNQRPNVFIVPVIHAVHTRNAFDVTRGKTKIAYFDILNDPVPDALIVGTERQRRDIGERYGLENIFTIPPAFRDHEPSTSKPAIARNFLNLVSVGRYAAEKNHMLAIQAFAKVIRALPRARLDLYGSGPERTSIEALVRQLNLDRSVTIHGFSSDVETIFRGAGMSLLTSQGEGFSLVVLESLSLGCPVAAFNVNYGPAEMICDGENGVLAPFGDTEVLAARIVTVLTDRQYHEWMCQRAAVSSHKFSAAVVGAKWRELLVSKGFRNSNAFPISK